MRSDLSYPLHGRDPSGERSVVFLVGLMSWAMIMVLGKQDLATYHISVSFYYSIPMD